MNRKYGELISYGHTHQNEEWCILADEVGYTGGNYLVFKESDIIRLAKEQGMIEDDEIIGYRVKEEFYEFSEKLNDYRESKPHNFIYNDIQSRHSMQSFRNANVLDVWFDPVYKEKKTMPKINGYDGKIDGKIITYGCAKLDVSKLNDIVTIAKDWYDAQEDPCNTPHNRSIKSITLNSDVTITIDEIKQIVDYIESEVL